MRASRSGIEYYVYFGSIQHDGNGSIQLVVKFVIFLVCLWKYSTARALADTAMEIEYLDFCCHFVGCCRVFLDTSMTNFVNAKVQAFNSAAVRACCLGEYFGIYLSDFMLFLFVKDIVCARTSHTDTMGIKCLFFYYIYVL